MNRAERPYSPETQNLDPENLTPQERRELEGRRELLLEELRAYEGMLGASVQASDDITRGRIQEARVKLLQIEKQLGLDKKDWSTARPEDDNGDTLNTIRRNLARRK